MSVTRGSPVVPGTLGGLPVDYFADGQPAAASAVAPHAVIKSAQPQGRSAGQ